MIGAFDPIIGKVNDMTTKDKYTLRISRLTIDKLGIQMYDRVSAVLAELIANAYDADAENVTVTLPFNTTLGSNEGELVEEIRIEDDGIGMTDEEVNDYYLNVGYDRRAKRGDKTNRLKRRVMGRKGIGKLAPFGICREVEVVSAGGEQTAEGYRIAHLILDFDEMRTTETDSHGLEHPYHPRVGDSDGEFTESTGTVIVLRRFNRKQIRGGEILHRQLEARFGIARDDWRVKLINSKNLYETFELGDLHIETMQGTRIQVDDRPVNFDGKTLPVRGWIAYSKTPYKDEVMAGVRIYARGKIVSQTRDFDISTGFTGEFKLRSYLTGAIHAEWLDERMTDLVRTDRQDIIWSSEEGAAFQAWGQALLKELGSIAEKSTRSQMWSEFLRISQIEDRLVKRLPGRSDIQKAILDAARVMVRNLSGDVLTDLAYVEDIVQLAVAIGPHKELLESLRKLNLQDGIEVEVLLQLFETARIAETYSLGRIAAERVGAIERLEDLIGEQVTDERDLQWLIESATWLINPEWTPISQNQSLNSFRKTYESWYRSEYNDEIVTSAIDNPSLRPDFVLLANRDLVYVVEIKRPRHTLTDEEFVRALQYRDSVSRFLERNVEVAKAHRRVKLILVCDDVNVSHPGSVSSLANDEDIERKSWHDLLRATRIAHAEFINAIESVPTELPTLGS